MQELAGLTEIKINKPGNLSSPRVFQNLMNKIPNEKYFYIIDEEADWIFDEQNFEKWPDHPYNWTQFDSHWDGDAVDMFYDDIFDNELKGKPGIEGDYFSEWQDIDRNENPNENGIGIRENMLVNKIVDIITAYKKEHFADKITEIKINDPGRRRINYSSIELSDVYPNDYPDFADAYIEYAEYEDGTPLDDAELDKLNDNRELVYDMVMQHYF